MKTWEQFQNFLSTSLEEDKSRPITSADPRLWRAPYGTLWLFEEEKVYKYWCGYLIFIPFNYLEDICQIKEHNIFELKTELDKRFNEKFKCMIQ